MAGKQIELNLPASGDRLDVALAGALPHLSRSQLQRLIKEGQVLVEGQKARASQRLDRSSRILLTLPDVVESALIPEAIPLDIRYEDDDLLVVNKPAGMVVHPAAGHDAGTLVNAVLAHCPDLPGIGGERRPGIVHRLDKDTSGLILVAKNDAALSYLQGQFKRRTVKKLYLALVEGNIQPSQALIDAPIGRDPRQRKRMAVIPEGASAQSRPAQTTYRLLQSYGDYSLVECQPHTGRTHQIRVHLAFAGFPIVGDTVYGRRKQRLRLDRHFLHAAELVFRRPADGAELALQAGLPVELQTIIDELGKSD
jgi:23S rRNA pseudouridine1911/1915/1917 synthase